MSLQLILGGSGQGKTTALQEKITKEAIENKKQQYIMLVPEQFTMETQKSLVAANPNGGILNIDVLSFIRLAYRIFSQQGMSDISVLDDLGKMLVLRKVLNQCEDKLVYFRGNIHKEGYVEEIKSFLSEMLQYGISKSILEELCEHTKSRPVLYKKMQDMCVIYDAFKMYLDENFIAEEEVLDRLADCIEDSDFVKDAIVCLDGYTGFTPIQYKLIESMLRVCKKVYITVTIDEREKTMVKPTEFELFALSKKTIQKVYKIAKEAKVEIEEDWIPEKENGILHRFKDSKEIAALEQNLFRFPNQIYKENVHDICIHESGKPQAEVTYVAGKIKSLLKAGYTCGEIAVVTGDMQVYSGYIEETFTKAGFPYFMDQMHDILSNPFVAYIQTILEIVIYDFKYESMAKYLKSPFTKIKRNDVDLLENYILAKGIRGRNMWEKEWVGSKKSRTWSENCVEKLQKIKETFLGELLEFAKEMQEKETVEEKTKILYNWMKQKELYKAMMEKAGEYEKEKNAVKVREYQQVYPAVIDVFERMVSLLGEVKIDTKEYTQLVLTGFKEARVGFIPASINQVIIGDMQRTRLANIKVLFVLGANDGLVPQVVISGGILSDEDRNFLKEKVEIAPTMREQIGLQQFYLYINLTKPSHKLWITYSKTKDDGKEQRPSYLCSKIMKIFPKLEITSFEETYESVLAVDLGEEYFLRGLRNLKPEKASDTWKGLLAIYKQKQILPWNIEKVIQSSLHQWMEAKISKETAMDLYGEKIVGSISRMECFSQCAYKHFLMYGVRLSEREENVIDTPDYGSFIHEALERFGNLMEEEGITWVTLQTEKRKELVKRAVEEEAEVFRDGMLLGTARYKYLVKRMERVLNRTVWAIAKQLAKSKYADSAILKYEVYFEREENELTLHGIIDRMEVYDVGDKEYVKIVDYKTGTKQFDIRQFYYGLQIQLVVYMESAVRMRQEQVRQENKTTKVEPAGIFYYNVKDPMISDKVMEKEVLEDLRMKYLRMDGLFNLDGIVPELLDKEFQRSANGEMPLGVKSDVVKMATKKDASFDRYTQGVPKKVLDEYMEYSKELLADITKNMQEGNIEIKPYVYPESPDKNGCVYCPYQSICHMDGDNKRYRMLDKDEEQIQEIFQERIAKRKEEGEKENE